MDRLTEWMGEHAAVVNHHANYIDRLAAYEDAGLEPEEIETVMALAEKMNVVDLVRENLRLANKLLHTEIRLKTAEDKQTNADRIRAMSDEELCELLLIGGGACKFCRPEDRLPFHTCTVEGCKNAMRNFLRQPAEGGEQDGAD